MSTEQKEPAKTKRIAIVTDGSCDITNDEAAKRGFSIVPIPLAFPDGSASDSDGFPVRDFWQTLLHDYTNMPKTSQPNVYSYEQKLQELADEGYEGAFILTLSRGLSATIDAALAAASQAPIPVRVMDSRICTWGMVFLCDAAVAAVEAGLDLDEVMTYVQAVRDSMRIYFVVHTLEYLVRGGRAGRAAGLLAAALDIKPMLTVKEEDGVIEAVKKCRGRKKAYQKIASIIRKETKDTDNLRYVMLYTDDEEDAEQLHKDLQKTGFTADAHYEGMQQVGIIVGIYAGPGTSAVVYWQDLDPQAYRTN